AQALGYSNTRDALNKHVDAEDKNTVAFHDGTSGNPNQTVINESGLYSLILSSKLPNAKKFKHWVTSEVLPSIRKTGSFTGMSKELQSILLLDSRTMEHDQRITALEGSMVVDYQQQRTLAHLVNEIVVKALGGKESAAYNDKSVRGKIYCECNRDIQRWFRVNSRNNIPRKRFDEAVEYIQRWHPSTNMAMTIRQVNNQESLYA
ncbi:MAG: ORF6C domain-containing protein, partial [Oscillospiraceae bacterium]|nr:ORF6C domain-containing protein [Oscillospiraceae bacterium]